ncbi:HK97-gp10 family putative phage morphogenesis protein [Clostridium sp. B9]|uniref:HK97-gp10 family putative phage morphogenesis protein n=1 Tax=Clostridium sp. B9 TaxID=3423224 RepID=UPI003D2EF04D
MATLEIEGFEEFEKLINEDMVLDESTKRRALRRGIKLIGKSIENNSPIGPSGRLSKIKIRMKNTGLATEATASSSAFYDLFQNFGTSEQKAHVGYFDRAVEDSEDKAIEAVSEEIFKKMR